MNSKAEMALRLPNEPPATDPQCMSFLFKFPCGARLERKFSINDSLEVSVILFNL